MTHIMGIILSVSLYTAILKPRSSPTIMGAMVLTEITETINKNKIPSFAFAQQMGSMHACYWIHYYM